MPSLPNSNNTTPNIIKYDNIKLYMKQKQIEDIFTNSKPEKPILCPNPNNPIIVDTREKNSLIAANLLERKVKIKFEKLNIGDYLINDICVERKTFNDFLSSMIDKRLLSQLKDLKKYAKPILLIEGFYYNYSDYNIHENAIRGMITSIATEFQIPIIFTEDEKDTSKYLISLARKQEKKKQEISIRPTKTLETLEERKQFILEGFPKIGPKISKQLLEKHKTLKNIFSLEEKDLKEFLDNKTIEKWDKIINS